MAEQNILFNQLKAFLIDTFTEFCRVELEFESLAYFNL